MQVFVEYQSQPAGAGHAGDLPVSGSGRVQQNGDGLCKLPVRLVKTAQPTQGHGPEGTGFRGVVVIGAVESGVEFHQAVTIAQRFRQSIGKKVGPNGLPRAVPESLLQPGVVRETGANAVHQRQRLRHLPGRHQRAGQHHLGAHQRGAGRRHPGLLQRTHAPLRQHHCLPITPPIGEDRGQ